MLTVKASYHHWCCQAKYNNAASRETTTDGDGTLFPARLRFPFNRPTYMCKHSTYKASRKDEGLNRSFACSCWLSSKIPCLIYSFLDTLYSMDGLLLGTLCLMFGDRLVFISTLLILRSCRTSMFFLFPGWLRSLRDAHRGLSIFWDLLRGLFSHKYQLSRKAVDSWKQTQPLIQFL